MQEVVSNSLQDRFKNDPYAKQLGFEMVDVSPGYAEVADVVSAQAKETHLTHHAGYYDMTVTTEEGLLIAKCQGMVYRTSREWSS